MIIYQDMARFWNKVEITGPDDCWEWRGSKTKQGYGTFSYCGATVRAHRFSFWIHTGVHPGKLVCCHSCDNPGCVNPAHLWLGTQQDNIDDAIAKNRIHTKLTKAEVLEIRARYAGGNVSHAQLGQEYGVSSRQIGYVVTRTFWKHI